MARDELTDGKRIGQLLSSEINGHERGILGRLAVVEADRDVEPVVEGTFAYGIGTGTEDDERIASAHVHPDRLRLEFAVAVETALSAADRAGLDARLKATESPQAIIFVENGAEIKAVLNVVRAVAEEHLQTAE